MALSTTESVLIALGSGMAGSLAGGLLGRMVPAGDANSKVVNLVEAEAVGGSLGFGIGGIALYRHHPVVGGVSAGFGLLSLVGSMFLPSMIRASLPAAPAAPAALPTQTMNINAAPGSFTIDIPAAGGLPDWTLNLPPGATSWKTLTDSSGATFQLPAGNGPAHLGIFSKTDTVTASYVDATGTVQTSAITFQVS